MSSALGIALFGSAALLYAAATIFFYVGVVRDTAAAGRPGKAPAVLLGAGAAAHLLYVLVASLVAHSCPVHSIHFFLSIAAVFASGAYLVTRTRFRVHAIGLIVAPVGLVVTLSTFALGRPSVPGAMSPSFIALHVFANLVGVALFLLACGAAVLYLVQERRLKSKRGVLRGGLPPLDSLDRALHRFLLAGYPLLTLGVATGTVGAPKFEMGAPDEVLRAIFGWATWLSFGAVLLLRTRGWRGRRAAYGTIAGFALAAIVLLIYVLRPVIRGTAALGG